jgi:hypothetical protein
MVVTLQVFNISIDPADHAPGREDLSINDIESCVELILEDMLGDPDAIDETDDRDEHSSKPAAHITLFSLSGFLKVEEQQFKLVCDLKSSFADMGLYSYVPPIFAPPPKTIG